MQISLEAPSFETDTKEAHFVVVGMFQQRILKAGHILSFENPVW